MLGKSALLLAAGALALSGCLGTGAPQDPLLSPTSQAPAAEAHAWTLQGSDCIEGGGHSNYNKEEFDSFGILPEPWITRDVTDQIGQQTMTSTFPLGLPTSWIADGPQVGIYHATMICASSTLDGQDNGPVMVGFVAIRIEAPPFDLDPAPDNYLVTVLSTDSDHLLEHLHEADLHASPGTGLVQWEDPGNLFHTVLDDQEHGLYEARLQMEEAGAMPAGLVRLWMVIEGDDGLYYPVSMDFHNEGGTHLMGVGQNGLFTHTRTRDHEIPFGPVTLPLPGAGGSIAGLGYTGFARTITPGPAPDVGLEHAFVHL